VTSITIAAILSSALCVAQLSSTVSLNNGVQIEIGVQLGAPTGEEKLAVEMARASGDSFYRIFRDQNKLAVFAYELEIGLLADGSAVTAVAKPVEAEFAARFPGADAGKPVPSLSSDHPMGPILTGHSAEFGLFEIPGMGLKVVDRISVKLGQQAGAGALKLDGISVSIDGKPATSSALPGSVAGRYAMIYIPGRGGYFFATEPPEGRNFVAAGSITGNQMKFTVDNVNYDVSASAPFLANSAGADVWVYHDPNYQPAGNWTQPPGKASAPDQFFTAASDSLNWWLPAPVAP
jgi:hypothetical protein